MEKKPEARRKLLEELKELFGPAFGPALEAHGRSFAKRLRDDEGFAAEARKLFVEGEEHDEFPALSGLLAGASDEEREEFFRDGWAREVLPPSRSTRGVDRHPRPRRWRAQGNRGPGACGPPEQ